MPHIISNLPQGIYNCALFLIQENPYLTLTDDGLTLSLKEDVAQIAEKEIKSGKRYSYLLFWINFSIGVEYLVKAVLIKHEIDIFKKKKEGEKFEHFHKLSGTTIVRDEYETGFPIVAPENPWLQQMFDKNKIRFPKQVNTETIGSIARNKKFNELVSKNKLKQIDADIIHESLKHLANHRRNNDLHVHLMSLTFIDNNDLPMIYLPLVNLLIFAFQK